ncbi:hypothetical protein [Granulicella rosea]|nr:hypothetical protein [Granulicella rosea]
MKTFLCFGLLLASAARAQEPKVDPNRVFTTQLHWERVGGAPRSATDRWASGSLAILYRDGTYAAVTASFRRIAKDAPISLSLNEGYVIRLGTWTKTDDNMIRIESREVARDAVVQRAGDAEAPLPGPVSARTCRLDKPSVEHLSDAIHCNGGNGLTLTPPDAPVDLNDLPRIVDALVKKTAPR